MNSLYVAIGGALGSVARYQMDGWVQAKIGAQFPYGTLAVNVVGSLLLALVMFIALHTEAISPSMRIALSTGVIGGFTTYSTFNYETLHLAQSGAVALAVINVAVTLVACLAAGVAGIWVARLAG